MKKIILIATSMSILMFSSCGDNKGVGTKQPEEMIDSVKSEVPSKTVNTNLQISLTETPVEKLGFTMGLPTGWSLGEPIDMMDMITYSVKSGNTEVFYIESSRTKQDNPGVNSMLEKWDEADQFSFLEKEDKASIEGGTRTGVVVWRKKTDDKLREFVFDYFLTLDKSTVSFAKFYPTDKTYNCNSIDTCIAIIKSIKSKKQN